MAEQAVDTYKGPFWRSTGSTASCCETHKAMLYRDQQSNRCRWL